jgi:hypothetical protein
VSITKIREIPSKLPEAHLYLDDIEEVCKIVLETYKISCPDEPEPRITFSTEDCRMDSITDLEKLGGTTTDFEIHVGGAGNYISFHSWGSPRFNSYLYPLSTEQRWAVYGQVKAIVERRQYRRAIPKWLVFATLLLLGVGIDVFSIVKHSEALLVWGMVSLWALIAILIWTGNRKSRVSFVRYHERSRVIAEDRKGYLKAIILLVIGAIIGGPVMKAVEHFISLWWK